MTDLATNFKVIRPSRHIPERGEVFVMKLGSDDFLFGRVVLAEPPRHQAPMPSAYLIYVYEIRRSAPRIDLVELRPDRLLIPPVWINRMPWTKGYFETISGSSLNASDLLRQHCFRDWSGAYRDEKGGVLPGPTEPCGDWGLSSYRWLDDHVSDALGVPRAP